ncbi:MAG TPA: FecR domain-containing protein, partial [Pedobacter sp.]
AILLALLSVAVFFLKPAIQKETATIAAVKKTEPALKGNIHKWIKLPDGSSVQLNSASHLDYPQTFAGSGIREVTLTGEAYFDIKHDALHPFIIHTGKIKTTVLGTAFNISAYRADKGVTVTVTRGKVKVEDEQRVLAILTPDQQLVWNSNRPPVKAIVAAQAVVAWKNSDLIMDDITLGEAARLITAHYGLQVHFTNDKVKNCRFTAAFLNSNEIAQVLTVLGDITGASLTIKDHTITIDGNGC